MAWGFTLIELLVALGILGMLTGMVIVYTSGGRELTSLYTEEAKLSQIILRAKSLAVATYNEPSVPCGYGVSIDYGRGAYALFAYDIPDCGSIKSDGIDRTDPARYRVLESYVVPPPVFFKKDDPSIAIAFFIPPDPATLLFDESSGALVDAGEITLSTRKGSGSVTIEITHAGQLTL